MRPTIAIFTINRCPVQGKWPTRPGHACGVVASLKAIVVHVGEIHRDRLVVGCNEVMLLHHHHRVDFGTQLLAGLIHRFDEV